jgi:hypothetical protein
MYYSVLAAANFDQKSDLEKMDTVTRPELLADPLFVKVSKSLYSFLSLLSQIYVKLPPKASTDASLPLPV